MMSQPGEERLPAVAEADLTPAQRQAAQEFVRRRRREVFGPFAPLLRCPELMLAAEEMGGYLRYRSRLPAPIREFIILMAAHHWQQPFEWSVHHAEALSVGVEARWIEAIAADTGDESVANGVFPAQFAAAWVFIRELLKNRSVGDEVFGQARAQFGEAGVVDMIGLCGYYGLLAMVMNVARTAVEP